MHVHPLSIRRTTRGPLPRVPFETLAREILPRHFELSLVLCADTLALRMNKTYRRKTYTPNVLTFPISKTEGEIFLNVREAAREAKRFGIPLRARLALLFAHGCLHLKGMRHGAKMESIEERVQKRFS